MKHTNITAENAERIALVAIEILCIPPTNTQARNCSIPAAKIREGRRVLEECGVHWRAIKFDNQRRDRMKG